MRPGSGTLAIFLGVLLSCTSIPAPGSDPVVIEFGEFHATRSQIDERFNVAARVLAQRQGISLEQQDPAVIAGLREQFLDKYATEVVLLHEARRRQLEPPTIQVERALEELFSSAVDEARFLAAASGSADAAALLRSVVRDEETVKLLTEVMLREIRIPAGDVITLHHDVKDQLATAEEVCVRHIQTASIGSARDVVAALETGADFAELAERLSTDEASAGNGGDLGCFERGTAGFRSDFERAAFLAEIDTVMGPVASRFGQHVLVVYEHRMPRPPTLNEAYAMIERNLALEQLPERLQALVSDSGINVYPEHYRATDK